MSKSSHPPRGPGRGKRGLTPAQRRAAEIAGFGKPAPVSDEQFAASLTAQVNRVLNTPTADTVATPPPVEATAPVVETTPTLTVEIQQPEALPPRLPRRRRRAKRAPPPAKPLDTTPIFVRLAQPQSPTPPIVIPETPSSPAVEAAPSPAVEIEARWRVVWSVWTATDHDWIGPRPARPGREPNNKFRRVKPPPLQSQDFISREGAQHFADRLRERHGDEVAVTVTPIVAPTSPKAEQPLLAG